MLASLRGPGRTIRGMAKSVEEGEAERLLAYEAEAEALLARVTVLMHPGSEEGDACRSAEAQHALASELCDWGVHFELERARPADAYRFYAAAQRLPEGPKDDLSLLEKLYELASTLGLHADAIRFRKRIERLFPRHVLKTPDVRVASTSDAVEAREVRYWHAKFGEGLLIRREAEGLRMRFASGERVIREDKLERRSGPE